MGALYNKMARDLSLKNLAAGTQAEYLRCCRRFVRYHMRSPTELGEAAIKEYLAHVQETGGVESLKMNVAALRFLYVVTLDRAEVMARIPWPKVPHKKPDILSGTETEKLLGAVRSPVPAMALVTAYGAGLRVSEVCRLRTADIDSKRHLIHVRLGKGGRDRYVALSERLLEMLREYWRSVRPKDGWLFPGRKAGSHLHPTAANSALKEAAKALKLRKRVTTHTLRHCFATHLLETGTDIRVIQALLGHRSIRTTVRYAQVSMKQIAKVRSPLDLLGTKRAKVLG